MAKHVHLLLVEGEAEFLLLEVAVVDVLALGVEDDLHVVVVDGWEDDLLEELEVGKLCTTRCLRKPGGKPDRELCCTPVWVPEHISPRGQNCTIPSEHRGKLDLARPSKVFEDSDRIPF